MSLTVEIVCQLLVRSRLLSADDVKALHQKWRGESKEPADTERFAKWLITNRYTTDYQAGLLLRGHADHFFLGQYKLLDRIGKGRMAGVYKGVHNLGQTVAIKVLPPSKAKDAILFGRFQREARLALQLKHPNIVRTFQLGEQDGLNYIVMEYLEGETLDEVLKERGKLSPQETQHVIHQALLGLQHLHEKGMVHRDIKPGNLMLVAGKNRSSDKLIDKAVKLLDIGLGRALFDEIIPQSEGEFTLTNDGALLGTPDYLAPEQARDAHTSDIRADIYSLGCIFYHCLSGSPPFNDPNLLRQLVRHASEAPRPLREINAAVSEPLQLIVEKMLAKDPAHRFQTPADAVTALQIVRGGKKEGLKGPESDADMTAYLLWLDAENSKDGASPPAPPVRSAPRTMPQFAAAATRPALDDLNQPMAPTPVRIPRPATKAAGTKTRTTIYPIAAPASPEPAIDVELVPLAASSPTRTANRLGRREFFILGIGASLGALGVLVAEGLGFLLARLLRRTPPEEEKPSSSSPGENP
jgi:serine/threonine protein kinase